jgi:hypothetical protein
MKLALMSCVVLSLAAASPIAAQETASETEPRPVDPAEDVVNRLVTATTVPGLVVSLRIEGNAVTLERAQPARIPKPRERRSTEGDTVTITGLAGAERVASVTVADPVQVAVEESGTFRDERRSVDAALPTPRAIDAIEVRVSTTGATARIDVRPAYAEICRALPNDPVCAGKPVRQPQ